MLAFAPLSARAISALLGVTAPAPPIIAHVAHVGILLEPSLFLEPETELSTVLDVAIEPSLTLDVEPEGDL